MVIPAFCTYIAIRIMCFSYSFFFLFLRFKGALRTTLSPMKNIGNLEDFNSIRIKKIFEDL